MYFLTLYNKLVYYTCMPHVSKIRLDKNLELQLFSNFSLILSRIHKTESMGKFLISLLSPTEQLMLAKRLGMFFLIKEGYSDTDISRMLTTTRMTTAKFRYFLDVHGEGFEIAWSALQDEKIKQEIHDFLLALAKYAAKASHGRVKATIL